MARILVIDDIPSFTALLRVVLEGGGHAVTERHDGNTGFAEAGRGDYDLILVDMMMPGIDGIEFVKRMRGQGSRTAIVAMSGGSDHFPAVNALTLSEMHGADALLFKPFENSELLSTVNRLIRKRVLFEQEAR